MIKDSLVSLGFTPGEADVYLALLELGETSSGRLITKSGVSRSKVYDVLERLKQKGFASETILNGVRTFQAAPISTVKSFLEEKARAELAQADALQTAVSTYLTRAPGMHVQVYQGLAAVKGFYNQLLEEFKPGDEYLAITLANTTWNDEIRRFFQTFHLRRSKLRTKARILFCGTARDAAKADLSHTGLYELRVTRQQVPSGICLFKDTVGIIHWGEQPQIIIINSSDVAHQYRLFFDAMWKVAA